MRFLVPILFLIVFSVEDPPSDTTKIKKLNKELTLQQLKMDSILARKDTIIKK